MAINPVYPVSSIDISQAASLNNNQITAMLVSGNLDPKFTTLLLNQMTSNNMNSILFGTEAEQGNVDIFGMQGMIPNNLLGATSMNNTDIFGASAFTSISPQFELSVYSTLIGKVVTATDPLSGQQIEGTVTSVTYQNGRVVLEIGGKIIPTENIIRIK